MLTTFAVTLNNHSVGAVSAMIVLHCLWRILCDDEQRIRYFVLAGFFSAFTAANELPALAFLVFTGGLLLAHHPKRTVFAFLPSAGIVVIAFFVTNYWAHDSWRPPYAHRSDGTKIAVLNVSEPAAFVNTSSEPHVARRRPAHAVGLPRFSAGGRTTGKAVRSTPGGRVRAHRALQHPAKR